MDFSKYFKKKNDSKVKNFSKLEIFEKVNDEELIEVSGGNFSSNLRQKRAIAGLRQKELGKLLYSSKQAVCNWEHGRREPSLEVVQEMANVFKCSIDDLLKDSENIN